MFYIEYDRKNTVFNTLTIRRKNLALKLVLKLCFKFLFKSYSKVFSTLLLTFETYGT